MAEAGELGLGLPKYVERDLAKCLECEVTPHFHSLVPDGVFVPLEGGVRFEPLSRPRKMRWSDCRG